MSTTPAHTTSDVAELQRRRATVHAQELAALLERRPDLWGVYRPADLAAESLLWSA